MPLYLSPGVYVEEVDAGPKPIQGVGTSTGGAVGVTVRGPTDGKPLLVTSFADFQRHFGGFLSEPPAATRNRWTVDDAEGGRWWTFPLSVKGFFDNGGQQLYVKRVYSSTATAAAAQTRQGLVSEVTRDAASTATTVSLRHLFGITAGAAPSSVFIFKANGDAVNNTASADGSFTVASYNASTSQVTFTDAVGTALSADGDFVAVHPRKDPADAATVTLEFSAKARGLWGNDLSARVRPVVGNTLTILPDPGAGPLQSTQTAADAAAGDTTLTVASQPGFDPADAVPFTARIGTDELEVTAIAAGGAAGQADLTIAALPAAVANGALVTRLRGANLGSANQIHLSGASSRLYPDAVVELDNGTTKETAVVVSFVGDLVTFGGALTGAYLDGHKARVIEAEVGVRYAPVGGDPVEEAFGPLRLIEDESASSLTKFVNDQSALVSVAVGAGFSASDITAFPTASDGHWAAATGGDDHNDQLTVDDFMGLDPATLERRGIDALELIDEVAIAIAPGMWSQTVRNSLIQHCELLQDRFAIVDPQDGLTIEGIREYRAPIDTKYGALYYPWLVVRDPSVGQNVGIAPSGHMAGVYARVDTDRGVHKAPANVVIRGITGFERDVTKREQDMLNPQGINAFRSFPGRGNRVWGARTLSSDGSWRYIPVRRLFNFVEESIDEGTQWVVFEPNEESLWARVRASVGNFLTTVWRSGALEGTSAEQAFFVICDRTTMTQDDIDNGRLICVIGIAPVKPAEFVIFRIQQKTLEATG